MSLSKVFSFKYLIDCSGKLVPRMPPPVIPNFQAGTFQTIITRYLDVFTHDSIADCPVTSCTVKEDVCVGTGTTLSTNFVPLGSPEFGLVLNVGVPHASYTICYKCTVTTLGSSLFTYQKSSQMIIDVYADCSGALTDKGLTISGVMFGAVSTIISSYEDVFNHNTPSDCPLTGCSL